MFISISYDNPATAPQKCYLNLLNSAIQILLKYIISVYGISKLIMPDINQFPLEFRTLSLQYG